MLQFNLLPDVKQQYIKAQRIKHLVEVSSTIAALAAIAIFVFLYLYVDVVQVHQLNNVNSQISSNENDLKGNANLNKILTIQNQLQALPALDHQKPEMTRIFNYLSELIPITATVSDISIDYTKNAVILSGNTDSVATVNQLVDTLKCTQYTTSSNSNQKASGCSGQLAFSNVVMTSFGLTPAAGGGNAGVSYTINFNFDPTIFDNTKTVKLEVPCIISTRSILDQPNASDQGTCTAQSTSNQPDLFKTYPGSTHG